MKVLKPGRPQKGWSVEAVCTGNNNGGGGCGASLLVEQGDLFSTCTSSLGEVTFHTTFKCVSCGVLTDITNCPHHIARDLPSKKTWEAERES